MRFIFLVALIGLPVLCKAQISKPHLNAHAHNDYEHKRPLKEAIANGFISVEADVYLQNETLVVSHDQPKKDAASLEILYLKPLDSLLKVNNNRIYAGNKATFYLMIDCKTERISTYEAIKKALSKYPSLLCSSEVCALKVFLSGNRPLDVMLKDINSGIGIDGRPEDVGNRYSSEQMPVISDNYKNWSSWSGKSNPTDNDLLCVKELADKVHKEGKKFRLWAIPDNEVAWEALLEAGVDFINTDDLAELNAFLTGKGL